MQIDVLDHGYVRFVEDWGYGDSKIAEAGIIEAARQSTQGNFRGWEKDEKLLRFLWDNKHDSPFEFAGMTIEVQAPIFVFREWHRHRTQSYNEMSGRYTELPDLYYIPSIERLKNGKQGKKNKQGSEEGFSEVDAITHQSTIQAATTHARMCYEMMLKDGVSRELARLVIPVNQYSRMRAAANLRNWLAFMTLRMPPNVQWETKQYGWAVADITKDRFPQTYKLFEESYDEEGKRLRKEVQETQA